MGTPISRHLWSTFLPAFVTACSAPAPSVVAPASTSSSPVSVEPVGEATSVRLSEGVTPRAYTLELQIDPRKPTFSGQSRVEVHLDVPTKTLVLHGRDLKIGSATVRVGARTIAAEAHARKAFGQRTGEDELVLGLAEQIPAGDATIEIAYEAPFGALWGLYRTESEGRAYAFTQLESIEARRMFPSFDEPRFKTPFSITIDAPSGMTAVSNAPLVRTEPRGALTRFVFQKTEALPTYLVAVAVGDLEIADGPKTPAPIRLVATHGRAHLGMVSTQVSADVLRALEGYFAIPYPYGKLDIVAIPEFGPGAMENAGLVTFREELLLTDTSAPASARRRQRYVVAHELAHQWFGDLVTMRWWDDLWLNEGFATWMQAKACDSAFPDFGAVSERVLDKTTALGADLLPAARPVRPKVELTDQIYEAGGWSAYQKGASVLAMLEAWVGPDRFQKGIRAYVESHAHGSVTSNDLFAALDKETGKPVSKVAASFLDQPGEPLIDLKISGCDKSETGPARIVLSERELTSDGPKEGASRWSVPVCVRVEGEPHPVCSLIGPDAPTVMFETAKCPKWIHPNAGETGYYRYSLPSAWLSKVGKSARDLTPTERAGLVANSWALAQTGLLSSSDVLGVLTSIDIEHESSRVVLQAVIDVLGDMRHELVDDTSREAFVRFVHKLLDPQRKRFASPPKEGVKEVDDVLLSRVLVLGGLFDLTDDPKTAADLEPFAAKYLADPSSVDADLGILALRVSARAGGAAGKSLSGARLVQAKTPAERVALTVALASQRDPARLQQALGLFLTGEIRASDVRHLKNGALRNPDTAPIFYEWMKAHFDELVKKLDGGGGSFTSTLSKACDEATIASLSAFLSPKLPTLEGAQRGFDEGLSEARRCVAIKKRDGKAFGDALRALH